MGTDHRPSDPSGAIDFEPSLLTESYLLQRIAYSVIPAKHTLQGATKRCYTSIGVQGLSPHHSIHDLLSLDRPQLVGGAAVADALPLWLVSGYDDR